jgi:hypothetical protein
VTKPEQAVIIRIPISKQFGTIAEIGSIRKREGEIRQLLELEHAGKLDGHELGCGDCLIFIYGQDADRIVDVIMPVLATWQALKGGTVARRYGPVYSQQNVTKY